MSHLFLGSNPERLAQQLAEALDQRLRNEDPFVPVEIIVPNPYLGKWLRFQLARLLGVAMNFRFTFLEQALWDMLRRLDPRRHAKPVEQMDGDLYRWLVLSVLLEVPDPDLAGLRHYLDGVAADSPARWRRAWHLADRMSSLIRDYEYHRQESLILPWIDRKPARV